MEPNQRKYKIINVIANTFLVVGTVLVIYDFSPIIYDNLRFYLRNYLKQGYVLTHLSSKSTENIDTSIDNSLSVFSNLLASKSIDLKPVNYKFSIVIEKLGVNAPVVINVPVNDQKKYMTALRDGVAHASVSDVPSENPGNTYLFAHSALSFDMFGKYTHTFNLLDKLQAGDKIHVFYDNKDYIYVVKNSEILPGWNTRPLDRKVVSPVLTLQSCYPPGTTLNRIVVTSELLQVQDLTGITDIK